MSDRIVNLTFIATCAILVGVILYPRLSHRPPAPASTVDTKTAGQLLEPMAHEPAGSAERSVYVFYSETCGYCVKSLPLYRRVLNACTPADCRVSFLTIGDAASLRKYLSGIGFDLSHASVLSVEPGFGKLQVTPTVYVTDRERRLVYAKVGTLGESEEDELLSHLSTPQKAGN